MLPATNPYASPKTDVAASSREGQHHGGSTKRLCFGWLAVLTLNLAVPLLMAWGVTNPEGRIGMLLAILFVLALGLWVCVSSRQLGFALVIGGVAVALSQVLPILQVMAGTLGFVLTEAVGLTAPSPDHVSSAETALAGFLITMTAGGLLVAAATVAGLVIQVVFSLRASWAKSA